MKKIIVKKAMQNKNPKTGRKLFFATWFFIVLLALLIYSPKANAAQIKYYGVDRVVPADFATLTQYNIDTVLTAFDVNSNPSTWQEYLMQADRYNINIVVIPTDWNNPRPNCSWGAPFHGSDISRVQPMLDAIGGHPRVIGIVNAHEAFWTSCPMTIEEMASIRTKLKDYVRTRHGREIKVWNYVDDIYANNIPANDIGRIMDVAVIWNYCIANSEATCDESRNLILQDRARINNAGLEGKVELVYLFQTFAIHGTQYSRMPTASEMYNWGCNFIGSGALDGFVWYTWGADWYSEDLDDNPSLWSTMTRVHNECIGGDTLSGDVNQDGSVNVLDVQACVNDILAVQDYGTAADVNKDGSVNVLDVQAVVNIILGV